MAENEGGGPKTQREKLGEMSPEQRVQEHQRLLDLKSEALATGKKLAEVDQRRLDILEKRVQLEKTGLDAVEEQLKRHNKLVKSTKELVAEKMRLQALGKRATADEREKLALIEAQIKSNVQTLKTTTKLSRATAKWKAGLDEVKKVYGSIKTLAGAISTAQQQFTHFDLGIFKKDELEKAALGLSDVSAQINKATGLGRNFTASAAEWAEKMKEFGGQSKDFGAAMRSLMVNMADFGRISEGQRLSLTQWAYKQTLLGISYEDTAKFMDIVTKSMGKQLGPAQDLQETTAAMGKAIGMAPHQSAKAWIQATPIILHYGDRQLEVFKKLLAQSKATGLEMNELLGVAKGFDTFEDAATKVANLNAMLGTQMNSVEMLRMEEGDRIEHLKMQMAMTGRSFGLMEKYEQKSIMMALGITDINTALRMFGTEQDEIAKLEGKMDPENLRLDNLNKVMTEGTSIAKQQAAAMKALQEAAAAPELVASLRNLSEYYATNVEFFKHFKEVGKDLAGTYVMMNQWGLDLVKNFKDLYGIMTKISGWSDTWGKTGGALLSGLFGVGTTLANLYMMYKTFGALAAVKAALTGGATATTAGATAATAATAVGGVGLGGLATGAAAVAAPLVIGGVLFSDLLAAARPGQEHYAEWLQTTIDRDERNAPGIPSNTRVEQMARVMALEAGEPRTGHGRGVERKHVAPGSKYMKRARTALMKEFEAKGNFGRPAFAHEKRAALDAKPKLNAGIADKFGAGDFMTWHPGEMAIMAGGPGTITGPDETKKILQSIADGQNQKQPVAITLNLGNQVIKRVISDAYGEVIHSEP